MMAISGAYFGFSGLLFGTYANSFYPGTEEQLVAEIFSEEPILTEQPQAVSLTAIMASMKAIDPEGKPLFAIVHDAGTDKQFVELFLQHPGRLIYSENYRFDGQGNFLNKAGYSDGILAKQMAFSVYRLHFGHYGGMAIKWLYFVLGLALTYVCITGINIWLIKRRYKDWLNRAWPAAVWGLPLAIVVGACAQMINLVAVIPAFWLCWLTTVVGAGVSKDEGAISGVLMIANGVVSLALLLIYGLTHQFIWFGAGAINTVLLLWAVITLTLGVNSLRKNITDDKYPLVSEV